MWRMLLAALAAAVVTGCSPTAPGGARPNPDEPVSSDDTPQPGIPPTPRGGDWITGEAAVDSIELLTLESFPLQVQAVVRGSLPDSCTEIDQVAATRSGTIFTIQVITARPADQVCAEMLTPYERNVALDVYGLPAGTYTVTAAGASASFTFSQDNILPDAPAADDPGSGRQPPGEPGSGSVLRGLAHVTAVEVQPPAGPGPITIVIRGWLPTPCVRIVNIGEELRGSTLQITVETEEPTDVACIQVIEEFEQTYTLQTPLTRGSYLLQVNEISAPLSVP